MQPAGDVLFKTLADPTRRSIFERLARVGEQSVHALTDHVGVSQPMVSKHLALLKEAGLVRDRREGRETYYSARPQSLGPTIDWLAQYAGASPA
jgi:DNA-binding transcriptional ArsR family regulator